MARTLNRQKKYKQIFGYYGDRAITDRHSSIAFSVFEAGVILGGSLSTRCLNSAAAATLLADNREAVGQRRVMRESTSDRIYEFSSRRGEA